MGCRGEGKITFKMPEIKENIIDNIFGGMFSLKSSENCFKADKRETWDTKRFSNS